MPVNRLKIPHQCGTLEYCRCYYLCKKLGKSWPEITAEEKAAFNSLVHNPAGLTTSAKTIFDALSTNVPKTHADLLRETGMCPGTIRRAIARLKALGLISEKFCWKDARQMLYQRKSALPVDEATGGQGKVVS